MPKSDQGVSQDRYQLIPRTLIFLTRGESVLLLKGAPQKRVWANYYNGIGGHIEAGEDVYSAARRELLEETGLIPDDLYLAGTVIVDTGENPGIGLFILKGSCVSGQTRPSEEGDPEWVPFNEIHAKPLVEDLPILLPRILHQKPSDRPFSGRYFYDQDDNLVIDFEA